MTLLPSALPAPVTGAGPASADGATSTPHAGGFLEMLLAALPTAAVDGVADAGVPTTSAVPSAVSSMTGGEQSDGTAAEATSGSSGGSSAEPSAGSDTESDEAQTATPVVLQPPPQQPPAVLEAVRLAAQGQLAPEVAQAVSTVLVDGTGAAAESAQRAVAATVHTAAHPTVEEVAPDLVQESDSTEPAATTKAAPAGTAERTTAGIPAAGPGTELRGGTDATSLQREAATPTGVPVAAAATTSGNGSIDVSSLTPVASTAVSGVNPAVATTGGTATAATAQQTPEAAPVAQQLFPEVSRLVSRGDGTHRLTMTLSPESLGDVQVTLVLAKGAVTVSFEAGDEARRALLESAPELRRLLELTGAVDTRVTVRDPAGTPQVSTTAGSYAQDPGGDRTDPGPGGQDPTGTDRDPQDQHAGTRDGQNAMDGTHRGTGETRRPLDPVASTRSSGLDVTV